MNGPATREALPDALRALAMLSVLTVNAAGYAVAPWGPTLGEPSAELADAAVQWLVAALLQAKGYPMLSFLFGMGLWWALRRSGPAPAQERGLARLRRLRGLGIVHGLFVYFGDILTLYGLVGPGVLRRCREPWRHLRPRLRRATVWALVAVLIPLPLAAWLGTEPAAAQAAEPSLGAARSWFEVWALNVQGYAVGLLVGGLLAWPVVRWCMWCGVAAARLRLLTHPRWRRARRRWTARLAPPLLLLNGLAAWWSTRGPAQATVGLWDEVLINLVGPPLAAVYLMVLAGWARGSQAAWCGWLAPLGSRTLTLYVGHGILCLGLLSGAGLAWRPGPTGLLGFALAVWTLALLAARASGPARWPLERWLAGSPRVP